jgi:membrane protein YqaA with SNARE-associated domain
MGILDSSFLFFPFGNDLLVVSLVARHHDRLPGYVFSAALGSTVGVYFLVLVARKLGGEGIRKMAGRGRFDRLKAMIEKRGAMAIVLACLAPPPFPFTMVIAAAGALDYPRIRILVINFLSRAVRFIILGLLAIRYGRHILRMANTAAFRYTMYAFIVVCLAGSAFSVYGWLKNFRSGKRS